MKPTKEQTDKIIRILQGGNIEIAVRDKEHPDDEFWINGLWFLKIIAESVVKSIKLQNALDKNWGKK